MFSNRLASHLERGVVGFPPTLASSVGLIMASPVILTVTSGFGMGGDTFALAVLLAFWVSWSVQARRVLDGPVWQILGGVTLLAVWGLAIWWTYAPPQLPLFVDPTDGSRGIPLR